jgi:branched-chain amino acid transport system permease protein
LLIGLIESLGGQYLQVRWTDVIIFSILAMVLVFRPTGLLGRAALTKS